MLLTVVVTRLTSDWQVWRQCQRCLLYMTQADHTTDSAVHRTGSRLKDLQRHLLQMHHSDVSVTNLRHIGRRLLYLPVVTQLPRLVTCRLTDGVQERIVTPDHPIGLQLGIAAEIDQQGVHIQRMCHCQAIVSRCNGYNQDLHELLATAWTKVEITLQLLRVTQADSGRLHVERKYDNIYLLLGYDIGMLVYL